MLISKRLLYIIIITNAVLGIILSSLGNMIIAITISYILLLWNTPGYFIRTKVILTGLSLFITWILLKILLIFMNKNHPIKRKHITYKKWVKHSTIFNIQFSYIITYMFVIHFSIIIFIISKKWM
jgi:hypothetical protein